MTSHYKVAGVWKQTVPKINVNSVWKTPKSAYVNINNSWKSWFLQGGVTDVGFSNYSFDRYINALKVQPDGKILVVGDFFIDYGNGIRLNHIARLNSDGTVDTNFAINTGVAVNSPYSSSSVLKTINTVDIQSDGKILIGGAFELFNGIPQPGIARLNSDGTLDTSFTINIGTGVDAAGGNYSITNIVVQPDDKILVGGAFRYFNNLAANGLVQLNSDGTLDTDFIYNLNNSGMSCYGTLPIKVQSDGKILVGGDFERFNNQYNQRIVLLNSDGTLQTNFNQYGTAFNNTVTHIRVQPDNKILVAGYFTTFKGITASKIIRLKTDYTLDTAFVANKTYTNNIYALDTQSDGKILVGSFSTSIVRIGGDIAI